MMVPVVNSNLSRAEIRCLKFYQEKAGLEAAALFGLDVYDRYLLMFSQSNPAIRHLVVASSSAYEKLDLSLDHPNQEGLIQERYQFALRNCNEGIQLLRKESGSREATLQIFLTAALILFMYDRSLSNFQAAIAHVQMGLRIGRELRVLCNQRRLPAYQIETLEALLEAVDRWNVTESVFAKWGDESRATTTLASLQVPTVFRGSMHESRGSLASIVQDTIFAVNSLPCGVNICSTRTICCRALALMEAWFRAFEKLGLYIKRCPIGIQHHYSIQRACALAVRLILRSQSSPVVGEYRYEPFAKDFAEIIEACTVWLKHLTGTGKRSVLLSLETECLPTLSFVASCCRSPLLRRRAITTLKCFGCIEGLEPSVAIAEVYEKQMKAEEINCEENVLSATVPAEGHLRIDSWSFSPNGASIVVRATCPAFRNGKVRIWDIPFRKSSFGTGDPSYLFDRCIPSATKNARGRDHSPCGQPDPDFRCLMPFPTLDLELALSRHICRDGSAAESS